MAAVTALDAQARVKVASAMADVEAQVVEHADDPEAAKAAIAEAVKRFATARVVTDADWQPEAIAFDFDATPERPVYVVDRLLERGTLGVLSGDTGAAKSIVASSLVKAAVNGEAWLDHETSIGRILVVDEENPDTLVRARLRALGVTNANRDRLRYFGREGISIGDGGASDAWLRSELDDYRPDLLVIDTLMAACDLEDTNSNSEAVRLMKHLRALAREFDCAVLLLHHERKRSKDNPSSSGQAMMGARQWAGQADLHMTLTVESDLIEDTVPSAGGKAASRKLRRTFKWRPAEKDRAGTVNRPRRVAVESEKDDGGRLLWMTVTDEGPIDDAGAAENTEASILGYLRDDSAASGRRDIAAAVGERNPGEPSGTFKRALAGLVEAGKVAKEGHRFTLTDHGRDGAPLAL
jgi:AAA domain